LNTWDRAWAAVGAHGDGHKVRHQLIARYSEQHRHYHTTQHLGEILSGFVVHQSLAERPAEVALALWFHDAIYDPMRSDNEQRSAAMALQALVDAGVDTLAANRVQALVLSTRHTALPGTADERLLVDLDLSILAASPARFAEYEAQIRREYGFVSDSVFAAKRREVLQSFLDRQAIFSTRALREMLEGFARRNLQSAIADWSNASVPGSMRLGPDHELPRRVSSKAALGAGYIQVGLIEATETEIRVLWNLDVIVSEDRQASARGARSKWAVYAMPDAIDEAFWAQLGAALAPLVRQGKEQR
jgi:predicted metal-dependent HD superfamily phosphohydrolase